MKVFQTIGVKSADIISRGALSEGSKLEAMPATTTTARVPKWTKHVVTELGGRDPLGLSRVSFMITDYLLKGIITTTSRARYYSFYTWALWHVEKSESPKRY